MVRTRFVAALMLAVPLVTACGEGAEDSVSTVTPMQDELTVSASTTTPFPCPLTNGVTAMGISGASGSYTNYCLDVPAGRASSYVMSGGTGDADMYVRIGTPPTTTSYNCRPYLNGNNETCNIAAQTTNQRIYITLYAYTSYSGVSLRGTY